MLTGVYLAPLKSYSEDEDRTMKIKWHTLAPGITYGQVAWYGDHYSRFAVVRSGTMYELSETIVRDTGISMSVVRRTYTHQERLRTIREAKALAQQWVDSLNRAHASP